MDLIKDDLILLADKGTKLTISQKKVLQTAIKLFAENGYSATSTAKIASEAGVSQGIIFKYYGTKEKLLNSILEIIINQLVPVYSIKTVDKIFSEKHNYEDVIHNILTDRYSFMKTNANLMTIILTELLTNNQLVDKLKNQLNEKINSIANFIEQIGGSKLRISGIEVVRLVSSQLMILFLEDTRLKTNSNIDVANRIDIIQQNILHASIN